MNQSFRFRVVWMALALVVVAPLVASAATRRVTATDQKPLNNLNRDGVLIDGFDVVSYFTDGKPAQGSAQFTSSFGGATYWFAFAEHKTLFDSEPEKYAPKFGGFCAYAVSKNGLRPIDPAIFHFVDGKLFLQHTQKAFDLFEKDESGNTKRAYSNWPKLVEKKASKFKPGQFDDPVKD